MPETPPVIAEPTPRPPADGHPSADAAPSISALGAAWPILLSLAVLGAIGYFTFDLGAFNRMMQSVSTGVILGAVGITALQLLFSGWRFQHISRGRVGLWGGMRTQVTWYFFASVTPSAVGGGPPAAWYMARDEDLPLGEATAYMLLTMLLDQMWSLVAIPLVLLATLYMDVIPNAAGPFGTGTFILFFTGLMAWALVFAYAMLFRPQLLERLADRLFSIKGLRRFRSRVQQEMRQFSRRAETFRKQPPSFYVKGFFLTAGLWICRYLLPLFIIWSVYADVDKLLVAVRSSAMMLLSLVLPTPGGAGGLEGLYALFLGPLMPDALMAPTLLTWRVLGYYIFIALGVYLSAQHLQQHFRPTPTHDATTN